MCLQPDDAAYHTLSNALSVALVFDCAAITGPLGYSVSSPDAPTDTGANIKSVLASLDCPDHMRVWRAESMHR